MSEESLSNNQVAVPNQEKESFFGIIWKNICWFFGFGWIPDRNPNREEKKPSEKQTKVASRDEEDPYHSQKNQNLPKGLQNYGNTCYINSSVQSFLSLGIQFSEGTFSFEGIRKLIQETGGTLGTQGDAFFFMTKYIYRHLQANLFLTTMKTMSSCECAGVTNECAYGHILPTNTIEGEGFKSLEDCLKTYLNDGYRSDFCKKCGKTVPAGEKKFSELSDFQIFKLEKAWQDDYSGIPIKAGLELDLGELTFQDQTSKPSKFDLKSFICYSGDLRYGHYTSFCVRDKCWYKFDDSIVQPFDSQEIESRVCKDDVLVLIYERQVQTQ